VPTLFILAPPAMAAVASAPRPPGLPLARIEGNESRVPAFPSADPVTDERLKSLERQVPTHTGAPLPADEEWRALKEICKTT
jgi:hypothetical protein